MAFEKMTQQDIKTIHERSCVILYGFNAQEIKMIQNTARLSGIKDWSIVQPDEAQTVIKDLLDKSPLLKGDMGPKEKVLLFNHIPSQRMNGMMEALKKCRMKRPLMAVVTETSIEWTLQDLIAHLVEERRAVSDGQFTAHS